MPFHQFFTTVRTPESRINCRLASCVGAQFVPVNRGRTSISFSRILTLLAVLLSYKNVQSNTVKSRTQQR
jgi:hypothetical protein